MGKLDIQQERNGEDIHFVFKGIIDEDVDFKSAPLTGVSKVIVDLEGIKSINSCGIREWIQWLSTGSSQSLVFQKCPKVIVDQINMVDGFLPSHGRVESFFVPYYNEDSGEEKNILFSYGKEFTEGSVSPPTGIKDSDGNDMEMDIVESKYFKFIKR